ncbi:MAG: hypothetical protein ACP5LF_04290 [Nitrososphaeria archaeon]|nr:hypothetical protein [Conexivisphaerales archaeon]
MIADNVELGYCELNEEVLSKIIKSGYGKVINKKILLNKYELFYLLQDNQLQLFDEKGSPINHEGYFQKYRSVLNFSLEKLLVYRELRQNGYFVEDLQSSLFDFVANSNPSNACYIKILPEGGRYKITDLKDFVKISIKHRKEPIIAIVERNGEVIFYKLFQLSEDNIEGNN